MVEVNLNPLDWGQQVVVERDWAKITQEPYVHWPMDNISSSLALQIDSYNLFPLSVGTPALKDEAVTEKKLDDVLRVWKTNAALDVAQLIAPSNQVVIGRAVTAAGPLYSAQSRLIMERAAGDNGRADIRLVGNDTFGGGASSQVLFESTTGGVTYATGKMFGIRNPGNKLEFFRASDVHGTVAASDGMTLENDGRLVAEYLYLLGSGGSPGGQIQMDPPSGPTNPTGAYTFGPSSNNFLYWTGQGPAQDNLREVVTAPTLVNNGDIPVAKTGELGSGAAHYGRLAVGSVDNQVLTVDTSLNGRLKYALVGGASFAAQVANRVFAGPASGADATPTFRALVTADFPNDGVTYAKMQNVSATSRLLGRITAGAGDPEELTGTQATTLLDNFTSTLKGLAPSSGGGTVNFLRADATWAVPADPAANTVLRSERFA